MKWIPVVLLALSMGSLSSQAAALDCSGAELYSVDTVKFGRWEVRMRAGAKSGTVSSFFLYYNRSHEGRGEPWRELDIEILGKNPKGFQSNPITGSSEKRAPAEKFHETEEDLSKTFHTYALEWSPDSIVWELDGKRIRKIPTDSQTVGLRSKAMSWRMNLWASAWPDWSGPFELKDLPTCQFINWIRYLKYTPGKGPGGSDWTEAWKDDFDTINTVRWGQGSWGFEGNFATFTPANVEIHNGMAVLALTRRGQEGTTCGFARGLYPEDPLGRNYPGPGNGFTLR